MGRQEEMISWEEDFIRAAQFALQNKKVVYHIYNSVQREDAEKYLYNIAGDVMLHYVEAAAEGGKAKEEDKKLIADFYKSALVGMTLEWLNSGMKYSQEPLIRRLGVKLKGNIEEALKRVEG